MGEVDDRRGTKIDAEARLGVAEWQLEHVIGAGEALFADQSGEVELHHLLGAGAAMGVRVGFRYVGCDLVPEAADDDFVKQLLCAFSVAYS